MPRTSLDLLAFRSARIPASCAALALGALIAAGCGHMPWSEKPPESAEVTQELTAKATVLAVDPKTRVITLRDQMSGGTSTVTAGPEVRNFAQIAPGDTVNVRYMESLAVAMAKPGEATAPSAQIVAGRAKPGQMPGAMVGGQVTTTVRIELVDTKKNIVVFTPPGGGLRAVRVVRPEGKRFIQGLKEGDQVEITYTEAFAVSVEKQ